MTITWVPLRRFVTILGVVGALVLGYGSIRAAAAWTAASAPLTVAPVSVSAIEDRLTTEQARSAALQSQLDALVIQSNELTTALAAAEARIGADASQAAKLTKDLKAAKKKLAALEASIRKAKAKSTSSRSTSTPVATTTPKPGGDDDGEGGDG